MSFCSLQVLGELEQDDNLPPQNKSLEELASNGVTWQEAVTSSPVNYFSKQLFCYSVTPDGC